MYISILLVSATPTIVLPHRTPSSSTSDFLSPTHCVHVSVLRGILAISWSLHHPAFSS